MVTARELKRAVREEKKLRSERTEWTDLDTLATTLQLFIQEGHMHKHTQEEKEKEKEENAKPNCDLTLSLSPSWPGSKRRRGSAATSSSPSASPPTSDDGDAKASTSFAVEQKRERVAPVYSPPPPNRLVLAAVQPKPTKQQQQDHHNAIIIHEEEEENAPKRRRVVIKCNRGEEEVREPPQVVKEAIARLGGREVSLVIKKTLFDTDVQPQQNRLSAPLRSVANPGFLREEEKEILEGYEENGVKKRGMKVELVEPDGECYEGVTLRKWRMDKGGNAKPSIMYVLNGTWRSVVERHNLRSGTAVQLWSFRRGPSAKLCLALAFHPSQ